MKKIYLFIISCLVISTFSQAHNYSSPAIPWKNGQSAAKDIQISLMTFGQGDMLTDWWGHTALLVKDTSLNVARVYNFGYFSFDEGFVNRFAMGRLIFWAGDNSLAAIITRYVKAKRSIAFQDLDIPLDKRLGLAQDLANAVSPENSRYLYHHYNENCATRLRDYIDIAVNGQYADSMKVPGRLTFREHTLRYTAHEPLMQWLLMFLMNDTIDKPIQKWNEVFLPDELSKYVSEFSYSDVSGNKKKLVSKSYIYYDSQKKPVPFTATNKPLWTILIGLFLGGVAILLGKSAQGRGKLFQITFLIYNSVFALIFGFIGTILFFMALFTDHSVTYGNENLFLANPITLLIFFITLILFFKNSPLLWKRLKEFWFVLAFCSILLLFLKLFPVFDQDNLMIVFVLVPVNIGFAVGNYLYNKN